MSLNECLCIREYVFEVCMYIPYMFIITMRYNQKVVLRIFLFSLFCHLLSLPSFLSFFILICLYFYFVKSWTITLYILYMYCKIVLQNVCTIGNKNIENQNIYVASIAYRLIFLCLSGTTWPITTKQYKFVFYVLLNLRHRPTVTHPDSRRFTPFA